ncbi:MAG TPA: hypothetical protein VF995_00085 [Actinomycetota bacterium]
MGGSLPSPEHDDVHQRIHALHARVNQAWHQHAGTGQEPGWRDFHQDYADLLAAIGDHAQEHVRSLAQTAARDPAGSLGLAAAPAAPAARVRPAPGPLANLRSGPGRVGPDGRSRQLPALGRPRTAAATTSASPAWQALDL